MKIYTHIFVVMIAFFATNANANEAVIEDVRSFYNNFAKDYSNGNFDTVIASIQKNIAEDFAHLESGEFSYDKNMFIASMKDLKGNDVYKDMTFTLDIKDASYDAEKNEINVLFVSETLVNIENTQIKSSSTCNDTLRVDNATQTFQLYRCDCNTVQAQ